MSPMRGETLGLLTPSTPSYTQKAINKYLLNEQINEMVDERMKEKKCMGETEGRWRDTVPNQGILCPQELEEA